MIARRLAAALALCTLTLSSLVLGASDPATARLSIPTRALLFLIDGVKPGQASLTRLPFRIPDHRRISFEEVLANPVARSLARAGGAALLSVRTVPGDRGPGRYLTIGAGSRAGVPAKLDVPVRIEGRGSAFDTGREDVGSLLEANGPGVVPGLLASALEGNGLRACVYDRAFAQYARAGEGEARDAFAALAGMDRSGAVRELTRPPWTAAAPRCDLTIVDLTRVAVNVSMGRALDLLRGTVARSEPARTLVVLAAVGPSAGMEQRKDELPPIILAVGTPGTLLEGRGRMRTLTSDTTRRVGLVSNEDIAPTILHFFGVPIPSEMNGSPMRFADAPVPFAMHARHVEARRIWVPVQVAAAIAVTVLGLAGLVLIALRRRVPRWLGAPAPLIPLVVAPLGVGMLAAGGLPSLTYGWVVPFVVAVGLVGGFAALAFRSLGRLAPAAAVGVGVLAFFVAEALRGWPDTPYTLLGGSALDGARFYGLPNVDIGLLCGAAVWLAASLRPWPGFALLVGVSLFAGFPDLGANIGGAVTILAAAGLWFGLAPPRGSVMRALVATAVTVIVGLAAVLAANAWLAGSPTHGTRFVQNAPNRGLGGLWDVALSRLAVGWRLIAHVPFAAIPVVGLLVCLVLVLRPPQAVRAGFHAHPQWRSAILTLTLAGIVAYVVNDSGPAAAGLAFGLAAGGILYLPLWDLRERLDGGGVGS